MSKIDLSQAKVGDKFRTRDGQILEYFGVNLDYKDKYELIDKQGFTKHFFQYGEYLEDEVNGLDLVEQVLDKPLNELIEEGTKLIKENDDAIAEENELQRRQEVLKYADMLFFNQKDTRIAVFGYPVAIEAAEDIVKYRDKYLKDGKLCLQLEN